jgi:hypothetical protein
MKKILVITSMVLIGALAGGRAMAQSGDKRVPVRTSDPQPIVPRATIVLPLKSGGAAGKTITPALPGGNKTIPAGHPAGGTATKGPASVSLPPLKPAAGSGAIRN